MASLRCGKCIKARPGQRVVRGPYWWGGDEDGGSHYVGTVVSVCQPGTGSGYTTHPVEVHWDAGKSRYYRANCTNASCDLLLIDAAPTGVIFSNITCGFCETKDVAGTRWKCVDCRDYNLCNSCYMSDKHNIEHKFLRYDDPCSEGFHVPPRKQSEKFKFYGIFPGAEVIYKEDKTGLVANVRGEARLLRKTDTDKLCYTTDKVDDSLNFKEAACGGYYYPKHMPVIALPGHDAKDIVLFRKNQKTLKCYDDVQFIKDPGQLRRLVPSLNSVDAEYWCGKKGEVRKVISSNLLRVSAGGKLRTFNPECFIPCGSYCFRTINAGILGSDLSSGGKGLGYGLSTMTTLHAACHSGKEDFVRRLAMTGADLEEADRSGDRAVHYAAGGKQSRILEVLLNSGVDTGACNMFSETALHVAIKENSVDCARLLARNIKDSQINIQDNTGDTVLHSAMKADMHQEIISLLLQVPTLNVATKNNKGETLLHIAASKANLCKESRILEVLLNSGVDIGACNMFNETALHVAIEENSVDCARILAKNVKDSQINIQDTNGDTVLHSAIKAGMQQEIISLLLQVPAVNVAIKNNKGETPLHIAASKADLGATQQILRKTTDIVDEKTDTGMTALYIAASNNLYEISKELITLGGCNMNILCGPTWKTALATAVARGCSDVVELLVESGADINTPDRKGNAPLHICANYTGRLIQPSPSRAPKLSLMVQKVQETSSQPPLNRLILAGLLASKGGDLQQKNYRSYTPPQLCDSMTLVEILLLWNTQESATGRYRKQLSDLINAKDGDGMTVLHRAVLNGQHHLVQMLLQQGYTTVDAVCGEELKTALSIAAEHGHCEIVELLVEAGADVNKQDANGDTPLHSSLLSRRTVNAAKISSALAPKLKAIATELENLSNGDIDTSLALGCFLIARGAFLKIRNKDGLDPLIFAGSMNVIQTLLKWAPETRASAAEEASVERSAGGSTVVGRSAECSAQNSSGPVLSCEQKHCSSENEKPKHQEMDDHHVCGICMERERTVAFLCGHGACQECSTEIKQCHICRAHLVKKIKLY